jgi:membrane dipeptidase
MQRIYAPLSRKREAPRLGEVTDPNAIAPKAIDPKALQARVGVSDAHADSLMWNRDLTVASDEGHVDFPRLREANVRLQCFTLVTRGFPFIGGLAAFAAHRGWPKAARAGEWAAASWQIDQLEAFCARSNGTVAITRSAQALEANEAAGRTSAILGVEGGHALEGRLERVQTLFDRGVRFMSLTHLSNNALGGSSFPLMGNRGLTPFGREVLAELSRVGMAVDVAHASRRSLDEILSGPAQPFCSHTGVSAVASPWRNLPDPALQRIAARGGVAGIILGTVYLGGKQVSDFMRHLEHALEVMGEDGVALGSDHDGMVPLPKGMRDVRDLWRITEALLAAGHPEARIAKVLGGNLRRFFRELMQGK